MKRERFLLVVLILVLIALIIDRLGSYLDINKQPLEISSIPAEYRACQSDSDCRFGSVRCCGPAQAISKASYDLWEKQRNCNGMPCPALVDPAIYSSYPACIEHLCELKPVTTLDECAQTGGARSLCERALKHSGTRH